MPKTLKSPIFRLQQEEIDFLTRVPEGKDKEETEKDIHRTGGLFINGSPIYEQGKKIDGRDDFNFGEAQQAFQEKFTDSGVNSEEANYFSHLMTHLCTQTFYAVPSIIVSKQASEKLLDHFVSLMDHVARLNLKTNNTVSLLEVEVPFNLSTINDYSDKPEIQAKRTIKYSFFADKTMQVSMDNPNDKYHEFFKTFFTKLLCVDKKNDPYNLLSSDVGLFIDKFFASKDYNATTLARLVEEGLRSGKIKGNLSDGIYERLSDPAKAKIDEIAQELERRNQTNGLFDGIILTIKDLINIVLNFIATIFGYGVSNQEFEEFKAAMFKSEENKDVAEEKTNKFAAQIEAARENKSARIPEMVF